MVKKVSGCSVGVGSSDNASSRGGGAGFFGFGATTCGVAVASGPPDVAGGDEAGDAAGAEVVGCGGTVVAGATGGGAATLGGESGDWAKAAPEPNMA